MAVYKALRGESKVQFVETARLLAVHTRKYCLKMPKRYTFFGVQDLCALADRVYNEVKMANSIYPTNQHEAQLRRDHLIDTNAAKLSGKRNASKEARRAVILMTCFLLQTYTNPDISAVVVSPGKVQRSHIG